VAYGKRQRGVREHGSMVLARGLAGVHPALS
jgi:hypothetical protein